jgi:intracellular sulfur oxidation DsrE/DsrF family protein
MRAPISIVLSSLFLLAAVGAYAASGPGPAGKPHYKEQKVVYHNDGGTPDNKSYFKRLLRNVNNHVDALGKGRINLRVVSLGDGLVLFQEAQADPDLAGQIDTLKNKGVKFAICNNTLTQRKIDWHSLYGVKDADIVPSGVAELGYLQQAGYSYIHP